MDALGLLAIVLLIAVATAFVIFRSPSAEEIGINATVREHDEHRSRWRWDEVDLKSTGVTGTGDDNVAEADDSAWCDPWDEFQDDWR
jgi:hypothetical protein